jgi:hypothetical protein
MPSLSSPMRARGKPAGNGRRMQERCKLLGDVLAEALINRHHEKAAALAVET